MALLQQIVQLLTEAPYNLVYHLITLLAMQVVLGMALGQWLRDRQDEVARRLTLGAAAILLARLVLALIIALVSGRELEAIRYLPPLEQAVNTVTLIGLIWMLAPTIARAPRLVDLFTFLLILATTAIYIIFGLDWARRTTLGLYNSDFQATVWGAAQLLLLVGGILLILVGRGRDWLLRSLVLFVLWVAHFLHQWNYPEIFVPATELPYLIRLGQLIAFPLLMVITYRHVLRQLLLTVPSSVMRPQPTPPLADFLQLAAQVIETADSQHTRQEAAAMVAHLLNPAFVGLVIPLPNDPEQLQLTLLRPRLEQDQYQTINLPLKDWPGFNVILKQSTPTELVPQGMGHQQIVRLYRQVGLDEDQVGPLLIEPLLIRTQPLGLLLLGGKSTLSQWPDADRALLRGLAYYIAHAMHRANAVRAPNSDDLSLAANERAALEQARDEGMAQQQKWQIAAEEAQDRLAALEQKAAHLNELEKEVAALREALEQAEEAMALAAAGSSNLSPEWVTRTVTRYSGELEAAQSRIEMLERALHHQEKEPDHNNSLLIGLIQELRTPMTSVTGYTDLLLSETMGILGESQRDFLQRIRANAERANTLLSQLIHTASPGESAIHPETNDVLTIIETAIDVVSPQIRERRQRLDLHLEDLLGQWQFNRDGLYQIVVHLLSNACQASPSDSHLRLDGRLEMVRETVDGIPRESHLLHLAVTDSGGGIAAADIARVFDPHVESDAPLIAGLGDTSIGLAVVRQVIAANQGRVWVETQSGAGSTFSVLLPLAPPSVESLTLSANGAKKGV